MYYRKYPPQLQKGAYILSVPKNRRKKSRFEVFHNMAELQKLLVKDLMVDFGITRMTNLGEAQFLDIKFERIVNLCAEIVGDIYRANALFVTSLAEYEQRRLYQDKAIANCQVLKQELQSIVDVITGLNINKYKVPIEMIEKELSLIKAWRKSDIRFKKRIEK